MSPEDREAIQKQCNRIAIEEIVVASRGRGKPRAYESLRLKHVIDGVLLPVNRDDEREALITLVEQIDNAIANRDEASPEKSGAVERELDNLRARLTSRPHFERCISAHEGSLRELMDLAHEDGRDALAAALVLREVISDQLRKNVQLSEEAAEAAHALASGHVNISRERRKQDSRDRLIIRVMKRIKGDFPTLATRHNDEAKNANEVSVADFTLRALRYGDESGLTHAVIANAWKSQEKQYDLRQIEDKQLVAPDVAILINRIENAEASRKTVDGEAPFAFGGELKP